MKNLQLTVSEASHLFDWIIAGIDSGAFSHEDSNGGDDVDSYTAAIEIQAKLACLVGAAS